MMVRNDDWLREWVKEQLEEGVNPELIKETLVEQGYNPSIVDEFFKPSMKTKPPTEVEPIEAKPTEKKPMPEVPYKEKPVELPEFKPKKEGLRRKLIKVIEKLLTAWTNA